MAPGVPYSRWYELGLKEKDQDKKFKQKLKVFVLFLVFCFWSFFRNLRVIWERSSWISCEFPEKFLLSLLFFWILLQVFQHQRQVLEHWVFASDSCADQEEICGWCVSSHRKGWVVVVELFVFLKKNILVGENCWRHSGQGREHVFALCSRVWRSGSGAAALAAWIQHEDGQRQRSDSLAFGCWFQWRRLQAVARQGSQRARRWQGTEPHAKWIRS